MAYDISPYLETELARQRQKALRLFTVAPPEHRATIKQILRELDVLPATVAESFLLQALGEPASLLRELDRAIHGAPGPATAPVAFRRLHRIRRINRLESVDPPNTPSAA
jgi:hypothetical protein